MLILVLVLLKVLLNSFPSGIILRDKAYTNVLNFEFYVTANNLEELECHAVQPILTSYKIRRESVRRLCVMCSAEIVKLA